MDNYLPSMYEHAKAMVELSHKKTEVANQLLAINNEINLRTAKVSGMVELIGKPIETIQEELTAYIKEMEAKDETTTDSWDTSTDECVCNDSTELDTNGESTADTEPRCHC